MSAAPSRHDSALTDLANDNDPLHRREECAKAFALAAETAQEPWTCLALWFANRSFLNLQKTNVNPISPVAKTKPSA